MILSNNTFDALLVIITDNVIIGIPSLGQMNSVLTFNIYCRARIDARTLKALYFAWDRSDKAEEHWTSIVEGTHPDITALKKKISKNNNKDKDTSSSPASPVSPAERSPLTRRRQQVLKYYLK